MLKADKATICVTGTYQKSAKVCVKMFFNVYVKILYQGYVFHNLFYEKNFRAFIDHCFGNL